MRSAPRTVDSLCAITNDVRPSVRASIAPRTSASVRGSSAPVASSSIAMGASLRSARAIPICCALPAGTPWPSSLVS